MIVQHPNTKYNLVMVEDCSLIAEIYQCSIDDGPSLVSVTIGYIGMSGSIEVQCGDIDGLKSLVNEIDRFLKQSRS